MNAKKWMGWVVAAALLLTTLVAPAQAQLAKSGKFAGNFGWHMSAEIYPLAENTFYAIGSNRGLFMNNAGGGFLHEASVTCVWNSDARNGAEEIAGYCTLVDPGGDKAFVDFKGKRVLGDDWLPGPFTFIGGTGKYKGLEGQAKWKGRNVNFRTTPATDFLAAAAEGVSVWEGEYKLP